MAPYWLLLGLLAPVLVIGNYEQPICNLCTCKEPEDNSTRHLVINCTARHMQLQYDHNHWPQGSEYDTMEAFFNDNQFAEILPFDSLPLIRLSFRNNVITTISVNAFSMLRSLQTLDLSFNLLEASSLKIGIFRGFKNVEGTLLPLNVRELHLDHNRLEFIEWDVFDDLTNLEVLTLHRNPLQHMNSVLVPKLTNLKVLNLSYTTLDSFPEEVARGLPELDVLDLSGNQFTTVPAALGLLPTLLQLNFDENLIEQLDSKSFHGLQSLEQLNISRMPFLKSIGQATFGGFHSLVELHCFSNPNLTSVHKDMMWGEDHSQKTWTLKVLNFSGNSLTSLAKGLAHWEDLTVIDLQKNPWSCTCELQWMITILVPMIYNTSDCDSNISCTLKDMRCSSPSWAKGKRMVHWLTRNGQVFCDGSGMEEIGALVENEEDGVTTVGASTGLILGIVALACAAILVLILAVYLYRRNIKQKKALATHNLRCRNPRGLREPRLKAAP